MAHDVLKLITVAAILALIVGLVALFASGYISAFKPGGVAGKNVTGGTSGITGGGSRAAAPAKSVQPNATMPMMPASPYGEAPPGYGEPQPTAFIQPQGYMPQAPGQPQAPEYQQEPPGQQRNVSPTAEAPLPNRQEVAPTATPAAEPEMPDMSQMAEEWNGIFDQLFQILSLIFSGQYGQFGFMPQWPAWPQCYPVSLK